jgi:hypothetical protein
MKFLSKIKAIVILAFLIVFVSACCNCAQQQNTEAQNGAGIFEGSCGIGGMKLYGSVNYDGSTQKYTLTGGGMNVWGNLDQHFYLWKKVKGDFSMTTKVAFEGVGVNAHRKIGIMIRDALTGESRCAHISIHGDGLTSLQYRSETGGITQEIAGPPNGNYITLEKSGNKIRMRTATDIKPTDVTAEIEMDFPGTFYVGLFICSHEADVLEKAYFTHVEFKK